MGGKVIMGAIPAPLPILKFGESIIRKRAVNDDLVVSAIIHGMCGLSKECLGNPSQNVALAKSNKISLSPVRTECAQCGATLPVGCEICEFCGTEYGWK
jgi:hypothetical protein